MTEPNASDLAEVPAGTSAEQRVTRKGMWGQGSGDTSGYGGIVRSFERFPRTTVRTGRTSTRSSTGSTASCRASTSTMWSSPTTS